MQGKQRRLHRRRCSLGTAERHQIPPKVAAAVNVDEAGKGHGGKGGRLCGGPLLLDLLGLLQAVQVIRGALCVGCGGEDKTLVHFQGGQP